MMGADKFEIFFKKYFYIFMAVSMMVSVFVTSGCITNSNVETNLDSPSRSVLKKDQKNEFNRGLSVYYLNGFWRHMDQMYGTQYFIENGKMGKPITTINHRFEKGEVFDSGKTRGIGVQMVGYLKLDNPGEWQFRVNSNDGIEIFIEDEKIVSDPSYHSDRVTDSDIIQIQTSGYHRILLRYYQRKGTATLEFYWKPPGNTEFTNIPETAYWHIPVKY